MSVFESYTEPEDVMIDLEFEDGETEECVVLLRFPIEEQQYIALMPVSQIDEEEGEVYFYRFAEDEDGEVQLSDIKSDEEFEMVADRYAEILDDMDFDELENEED